jgi:hypothetical protein
LDQAGPEQWAIFRRDAEARVVTHTGSLPTIRPTCQRIDRHA